MWSDNDGPYHGTYYHLEETLNSPQPLSRPRPPIMIGGDGEQKTLKLVARYADSCNLFGVNPEHVQHKLDVLRQHCADEGRDYDAIEKTALLIRPPLVDIDATLADIEQFAALGVSEVQVMPAGDPVAFTTEIAEKLLPHLNTIG